MASPVDAGRIGTNITTASDPWTVNLPGSIAAGDLLIMLLRAAGPQTTTGATGWTFLVDDNTADASNDFTSVLYRWADGSEGSTVSVDFSATIKGAALVYRITGAENPATQEPEISTHAVGTGANADPGTVTPTGGSKDYLFIVFGGLDGETQTFSAAPSGYSNLTSANSGTASTPATNCVIASASKQATASSENPGTFTSDAPEGGWTAYTIAIHPSSGTTITPAQLTHTRDIYSPKIDPKIFVDFLTHARAIFSPRIDPKLFPQFLVHTRDIYSPTVTTGTTITPGQLVHTRDIYSPTIHSKLFAQHLVHTRAIYDLTVSTGTTIFPAHLTHTRAIFSPSVNPGVAPGNLVHVRAIYTPQINTKLLMSQLVHTRAMFAPNVTTGSPPISTLLQDHVPPTLSHH